MNVIRAIGVQLRRAMSTIKAAGTPAALRKALLLTSMMLVTLSAQKAYCEQKIIAQIQFDNQTGDVLYVDFASGIVEPVDNITRNELPQDFTYPVEINAGEAPKLVMGFNGHPRYINAGGAVQTAKNVHYFLFYAPPEQSAITAIFKAPSNGNVDKDAKLPYIDFSSCYQTPDIEGVGRCCSRQQTGSGDNIHINYDCTLPVAL